MQHEDLSKETKFLYGLHEYCPDPLSLSINHDNILKAMGMNRSQADDHLMQMIRMYSHQCIALSHPRTGFRVFPNPRFDNKKFGMYLEDTFFHTGKMVTSFLRGSSHIAIFVATCGHRVEDFSRKLQAKGDMLEGYIVDLMGSEIAESIAGYVHNLIENKAAQLNIRTTNRYSPGYCNWPVSEQPKLFHLINWPESGIRLTSTSLMWPMKSVSGMIGMGKNVKQLAYKCKLCPDESCIMREKE